MYGNLKIDDPMNKMTRCLCDTDRPSDLLGMKEFISSHLFRIVFSIFSQRFRKFSHVFTQYSQIGYSPAFATRSQFFFSQRVRKFFRIAFANCSQRVRNIFAPFRKKIFALLSHFSQRGKKEENLCSNCEL